MKKIDYNKLLELYENRDEDYFPFCTAKNKVLEQNEVLDIAEAFERNMKAIEMCRAKIVEETWKKDLTRLFYLQIYTYEENYGKANQYFIYNLIKSMNIVERETKETSKANTIDESNKIFNGAFPTKILECSSRICKLYSKIMKLDGGVFCNSPLIAEHSAVIMGTICECSKDMNEVISALYKFIYDNSSQYQSKIKFYINQNEFPIINYIRYIRLDYEHDTYNQENYADRLKRIANSYQKLINKRSPVYPEDYTKLQYEIYVKLEKFLEVLANRIASKSR